MPGVNLCILAAGLFTYDQVSLLMIFLGAAGTCFILRADLRLTAALYAIAILTSPADRSIALVAALAGDRRSTRV